MGRYIILTALILGLIGAVSAQSFGLTTRSKYPVTAIDGCKPGALSVSMCPVRTECFRDTQFKNGGRCDCNPLFWKVPKSLPFNPDSEWDDGFTTEDCQSDHFSVFLANCVWFLSLVMAGSFIYTDFVVLRELIRAKALKWNATAYSLVLLLIYAFSQAFTCLIYGLNNFGRDEIEFWYNSRTVLFLYVKVPCELVVDLEICCTWVDLYDRTNKMSKNSSTGLKVLRWVLRVIAIIAALISFFYARQGGIAGLLVGQGIAPTIGVIITVIGGYLITKTLCPNVKDVANPNWMISTSIRRAVKNIIICKCFELVGLAGMYYTLRHPQTGYAYGWFCLVYFFTCGLRSWNWLQYLIYGSRKHLKKFSAETSSSYFGFSTIGLNKTLTTVSSRMGSAISSKSSVIASKSHMEKD